MKERMRRVKKAGCFLLCLVLNLWLLSVGCIAASGGQKIRVQYSTQETVLSDAVFELYRIGEYSDGVIIPDADFSSYQISFDISDAEKASVFATTLSAYVSRDKIKPLYTDSTDESGIADFDDVVFQEGAYLLMAEKYSLDGYVYFAEPVVVAIPSGEQDTVTLSVKYKRENENGLTSYRVLKSWSDDTKQARPDSIRVQLLKDGEIYDTVVLNSENNWRYEWNNLSAAYNWIVAEKDIPEGYQLSISCSDKTFVMKNLFVRTPESATTSKEETTAKTPNVTDDDGNKDGQPLDEKLPQTGSLRWPIPYLAMAGVLVFTMGYVKYMKKEDADE